MLTGTIIISCRVNDVIDVEEQDLVVVEGDADQGLDVQASFEGQVFLADISQGPTKQGLHALLVLTSNHVARQTTISLLIKPRFQEDPHKSARHRTLYRSPNVFYTKQVIYIKLVNRLCNKHQTCY